MSTRKLTRAVQQLFQQIRKLSKTLTKGLVHWLLRALLVLGRRPLLGKSGFVLPTTVLLLLVLTLTVGSIGYRTYTRTVQAIGTRQQRIIFNAATPAIDRARSKLELLFDGQKNPNYPGGIPSEDTLLAMLYNDGREVGSASPVEWQPDGYDPFTFPDETRVNVGGDGGADNAWRYQADTNGDGTLDATVAYSILFSTEDIAEMRDGSEDAVRNRAQNLMVRHGPLSNSSQGSSACVLRSNQAAPPFENGWFRDESNTAILRKNFQVNAYVLPDNPNGTVTTLEFHQDRQVNRGNRWGAWFRNDLEIFPGPDFNWNGAMHTEGNFVVMGENGFTGYMISSPASCLYDKESSLITSTEIIANPENEIPAFEGQFISGRVNLNEFDRFNRTNFHLYTAQGRPPIQTGNGVRFNPTTDSVQPTGLPGDYMLDPVKLQTEDVSVARNVSDPALNRDPAWDSTSFEDNRMQNEKQDLPRVDDSYRADNRFGPRPRYAGKLIPRYIGYPIDDDNTALIGDDPRPGDDASSIGLDGYWERRARREGLRVIVGQRLELGDPMGWGGSIRPSNLNREPLRPWQTCTTNNAAICNEARQRRTLWDNLAAVQATAVYHTASDRRDYPVACLATTVHPGTPTTLTKSATFEPVNYGGLASRGLSPLEIPGYLPGPIYNDFFRGRGTNGWEFEPPDESFFRDPTSSLMLAMKNLATFAGDPDGGAPSFQPVQNTFVHPYPAMSMWGDFSMLRQVLVLTEDNGYDSLSPADKTVLHTSGCMMGMLAFNIDYLEQLNPDNLFPSDSAANDRLIGVFRPDLNASDREYFQGLRGRIRQLIEPPRPAPFDPNNGILRTPEAAILNGWRADLQQYTSANLDNPEALIRILEQWRDWLADTSSGGGGGNLNEVDEMNREIALAQLLVTKEQVARDRRYGFFGWSTNTTSPPYGLAPLGRCSYWRNAPQYPLGFPPPDPSNRRNLPPIGAPGPISGEPLGYLCSNRPRYPILYSLFPAKDDIAPFALSIPSDTSFQANYAGFERHEDISNPAEVETSRDTEDSLDFYIQVKNRGLSYEAAAVQPSLVRILPKTTLPPAWTLPGRVGTPAPGSNGPNNNRSNLIKICDRPCLKETSGYDPTVFVPGGYQIAGPTFYRIPFKDSSLLNGREMMGVRVLDMDLDLMRNTPYGGDYWLPKSGIVYAFREDATSELEIVRPTRGSWNVCRNSTTLETSATCRMNTNVRALRSLDPPLNSDNLISPKPVDYYGDPDRRPYGFRLRNGSILGRPDDQGRGLSLISDNPVYIQGDFNLHQTGGTRLEEFRTLLQDDFRNFYQREDNDDRFARPDRDDWRPSEILSDAITLLSNNFCDGSIEDAFITAGTPLPNLSTTRVSSEYGCQTEGHARTSYLSLDRPSTNPAANPNGVRWLRSNVADSISVRTGVPEQTYIKEGSSPIVLTRENNPMQMQGPNAATPYTRNYYAITRDKPRMAAFCGTRINSIIISGLVPSRPFQSYGGLHNFPRFLEEWGSNCPLYISGSFLQLNFSTNATGPYDQDAFEVGTRPVVAEEIRYYQPPARRWGYDVGLQIAPAGPIAQRFVSPKAVRNEFYTEPPADDPYIRNLCLAISDNCAPED